MIQRYCRTCSSQCPDCSSEMKKVKTILRDSERDFFVIWVRKYMLSLDVLKRAVMWLLSWKINHAWQSTFFLLELDASRNCLQVCNNWQIQLILLRLVSVVAKKSVENSILVTNLSVDWFNIFLRSTIISKSGLHSLVLLYDWNWNETKQTSLTSSRS